MGVRESGDSMKWEFLDERKKKTDLCHVMSSVVSVCGLCTDISTILVIFVVKSNQRLLCMMNLKGPLCCHSLQIFQTVLFNLHF